MSVHDLFNGVLALFAVGAFNVVVRFVVVLFLNFFGLWHPEWDAYWPRIPWRPVWRACESIRDWFHDVFGIGRGHTGRWTGVLAALCLRYSEGKVLLGRSRLWFSGWIQPMGLANVQRHLVMVAGAASGKTSFLATILDSLKLTQSALIVDPKGSLTQTLVEPQQARGRRCHVLDPLSVSSVETACWNYLAEIPRLNERLGQDLTTLFLDKVAEANIEKNPREKPFFPDSARTLWSSINKYVLDNYPISERHPITARRLVMHGLRDYAGEVSDGLEMLWHVMANSGDPYIAKGAALMMSGKNGAAKDILSTVRTGTAYLDHPQVQRVMQSSTFSIVDLKGGSDWLFLVAPTTEIRGALSPWFRILTMTALWVYEQIPGGLPDPTLFALDEFPSLGHIPDIEAAAPVMRGYGVRLLTVGQDIEQYRRVYPESYGGFFGNAEAVFWMGCGHRDTAAYLSGILAKRTRVVKTGFPFISKNRQPLEREHDLMTADQVKRFLTPRKGNMIVTRFGEPPVKAKVMPYFKALPVWRYLADPEHGDSAGRGFGRRLLGEVLRPILGARAPAEVQMSESDARAIFGLPGAFSRHDLVCRQGHLEQRAASTHCSGESSLGAKSGWDSRCGILGEH